MDKVHKADINYCLMWVDNIGWSPKKFSGGQI